MPFDDPLGRIEDILEAIEKIERYTRGFTLETFLADELTVDAVTRNFIIIGEPASHISPEMMARYPEIPWHQMRGLRNIEVHEYTRVDNRVIWRTAIGRLSPLVPQLREILEREA